MLLLLFPVSKFSVKTVASLAIDERCAPKDVIIMESSESPIELPSKEDFSAVVDSDFVTRLADREVVFHFFKLRQGISSKFQESFSLMFRTPLDISPVQGMYDFEHSTLGALSLFLVPIGQKEDHFVYESVFNNFKVTE